MKGTDDVLRRLAAERDRVVRQADDLAADLQAIIDASADANADDEHDPEGATIGFERAQVASLLDQARGRLTDLDVAADRLHAGNYGRCERCGDPIAAERLDAHPTATTCLRCASTAVDQRPLNKRSRARG